MKKKKMNKAVVAILVLAFWVVSALLVWWLFGPNPTEGYKYITIEVIHKVGDPKNIEIKTDAEFLGDVLQAKDLIEGEEGPYGLYVLTVDGETADQTKEAWMYKVNGEDAVYGVDACPINDGDHYEFEIIPF